MTRRIISVDENFDLPDPVQKRQVRILSEIFSSTATEIVYNVKKGGLVGNGSTDDTTKLEQFIASIPSPPNAFGEVSQRLHFPAGRYILSGSFTFPRRLTISGDGPYTTILYRKNGATGDFITLKGSNSIIRDLTIDGNTNGAISGDNLVLASAFQSILNCTITNAQENGVSIGKGGGAIGSTIDGLLVRGAKSYGIQVMPESHSTDGMWSNSDVGTCGLSGIRIDDSAQNLTNIHTWGCGLRASSTLDAAGFYLTSSNNTLTNCQAETNRGHGIVINGSQARANRFVSTSSWGNRLTGFYILNSTRGSMTGCAVYNNGVSNTEKSGSPSFAGIYNEGGRYWSFSGNVGYDSGASIPAGSYSNTVPYPYPGRTATFTQTTHYVERPTSGGALQADLNTFVGNSWASEATLTGIAIQPTGAKNVWQGNQFGNMNTPSVASNVSINPPAYTEMVDVSGTAEIKTIVPQAFGSRLTLRFIEADGIVLDTGNIKISKQYVASAGSTLTLFCDGTQWQEIART